jgi:hypothetical protein
MKFCQAIGQVKCLNGEKSNVSKTISVLILRVTGTEMVFKTLVFSLFNHLTQLIA